MFGIGFIARKVAGKVVKGATKSLWDGITNDLREIREGKDAILSIKATAEAALDDDKLTPAEMRDVLEEAGRGAEQIMEAIEVIETRIDQFKRFL